MNARHACALSFVGFAVGCGGAPAAKSARERLPENIVLRVDRVVVAPKQPGTQNRWDGTEREPRNSSVCSLLALGTNLVSPVSGEHASELCGALVRLEHRERFPEDPDLRVRLAAGPAVGFDSPVALDLTSHSFAYEFVVPSAAVPADGLRLEVLDDDANDGAQTIGVARLTLETLAKTYESPTRLLSTSAGAVLQLEIVVSPYTPMDLPKRKLLVTTPPAPFGKRPLVAGEVVHLRAEGHYKVGSWYDATLGPAGYSDGSARRYNFEQEPFASAPHAAGIALAGKTDVFVGALVAPCITFTSPYAGQLRVGINDNEPGNNDGWITFEGFARAPTVEEWGRRMNAECR
ncbi:MAG TPA: hypothetical protein VFZ53_07305 [Polyangiaceae bacterium]